uniref:ATP synthase complex subunit 8 n=1 Tax=Mespilia globulus TaxID=39342 RepID=A0A1W5HY36_9ECHN|nr:ATP synthase F0 subunit 8 [Mespilia globulus]AID60577.1 ATP synthase F0 subunit 8 [Mespilia globulus]
MPQLEFVWWVINFLLVWIVLFSVITIISNNKQSTETIENSSTSINKTLTTWQWA